MRPAIVFYVSGHGFGHASRDIEVINAIGDRAPEVEVVVRTAAKRWLFDLTLTHAVAVEPFEADTGVVQFGSLRLDEEQTIRRAAAFHADLDRRAKAEAAWLAARGARLVVADIPPLGLAASGAAGLPGIALGNFTWDWIYEGYEEQIASAPGLVPAIRRAYAQATDVLRLPMWGGFASIAPERIRDVPLIARRSRRGGDQVRRDLGLPSDERLVLLSFGGFGLERFDLAALAHLPGYRVVSTGQVGARAAGGGSTPGIIEIDERALYGRGLRYEDLVSACDVVATKPGFGIIAECAANGTALLYTSRGRFVEYEVLVRAMPSMVRAAFIPPAEFHAGRWAPYLDEALSRPAPAPPRVDGADVVASFGTRSASERRIGRGRRRVRAGQRAQRRTKAGGTLCHTVARRVHGPKTSRIRRRNLIALGIAHAWTYWNVLISAPGAII